MSITDELRERIDDEALLLSTRRELWNIADRIDAEHESACGEAYGNGVQSVALPDMTAYVKLPVDADGEPIHVGDVMDGYGKTIEVVEIRHGRSGWVIISRDGNGYADTFAFTHYKPPTVENILLEFVDRWCTRPDIGDEDILAKYAAKLRLAGDGE